MTESRANQLDPVWMAALGFELENRPSVALYWRNTQLDLSVRDTYTPGMVVIEYTIAVQRATVQKQQLALREVLLPAMGLEIHEECNNFGGIDRGYVREENGRGKY